MAQLPPSVDPAKTPLLPAPTGQISNFVDPSSLAPVAEGVGGVLIGIETILVILRTCSNVKATGELRFDDYWIILATLLTYGLFIVIMCLRPFARHAWDIPLTAVTEANFKAVFAEEMLYGITYFFSKASLLLLLYRLFSPDKVFRYKLYGAFVFVALTTLSSIPMYLALCVPDGHGWIEAQTKCAPTDLFDYVAGPSAVAFDLFLVYLPASVIAHLHLPLRRRIGIIAIFMTGMLAVIASLVGLVFRIRLAHPKDAAWDAYIVELCTLVESCVSIICSCMPAIPAISKLIASNSYFISLRSLIFSRTLSSDKSRSSKTSSKRKLFQNNKNSNESEPYFELIESGTDRLGPDSTTKTDIQHVSLPELPVNSGIHVALELEVLSAEKSPQDSSRA